MHSTASNQRYTIEYIVLNIKVKVVGKCTTFKSSNVRTDYT